MLKRLNKALDKLSEFFAARKGLLPLLGLLAVMGNWILNVFWPSFWIAETDTFLHLGLVAAILGFLLAWAL